MNIKLKAALLVVSGLISSWAALNLFCLICWCLMEYDFATSTGGIMGDWAPQPRSQWNDYAVAGYWMVTAFWLSVAATALGCLYWHVLITLREDQKQKEVEVVE